MIQLLLLTGFLGAGKTTLLNNILDGYQDQKIGIIVNEFGSVNVDGRLLHSQGIQMAELSNGSIFCACIKDKFVDSLIALSNTDIEYLFVEASGLADPSNMPQILQGIEHKTGNTYLLKGTVCIVDGEHFLELLDLLPALHRQVEYGDMIVINKADLIEEKTIDQIEETIKEINPDAEIGITSYCRLNIPEMLEHLSAKPRAWQETTNTYESRPNTFVLKAEEFVSCKNLKEFLEEISQHTYRIKGFSMTDQGPMEINAVREDVRIIPWREEITGSEIVLISAVGIRLLSLITSALEKNLKGKLHL